MTTRTPPHDLEAEEAVLSIGLTRPATVALIDLSPDDFYKPTHQHLWEAMLWCATNEIAPEPAAVAGRLRAIDLLDMVGGPGEILRIAGLPTASQANLRYYVHLLRDKATRRRLILAASNDVVAPLWEDFTRPVEQIIGAFLSRMEALVQPDEEWTPQAVSEIEQDEPERTSLLTRSDGVTLLYAGKAHSFNGEPESLKSWLAQCAAAEVASNGGTVLYLDYEDSKTGVASRFSALSAANPDRIFYLHPATPLPGHGGPFDIILREYRPILVIVDGMTEAFTAHGLDPYDNGDAARFWQLIPRRATAAGAAVILVDHVVKNREDRGRYAIGAQHKLAALDGGSFTIQMTRPFGHGLEGKAKITVEKDRPGDIRSHAPGGVAGWLTLTSYPDGGVSWRIDPPAHDAADVPTPPEPSHVMERVSRYLEANPDSSLRMVRSSTKAKAQTVDLALDHLERRGCITVTKKQRGNAYRVVTPYRADQIDEPDPTPEPAGEDF